MVVRSFYGIHIYVISNTKYLSTSILMDSICIIMHTYVDCTWFNLIDHISLLHISILQLVRTRYPYNIFGHRENLGYRVWFITLSTQLRIQLNIYIHVGGWCVYVFFHTYRYKASSSNTTKVQTILYSATRSITQPILFSSGFKIFVRKPCIFPYTTCAERWPFVVPFTQQQTTACAKSDHKAKVYAAI